ncbi:hypothetical protein [uncultured Methanomethylovorans sp.]|uniref:hypothetical protein n=1 Tax=uncultured Methanomethylovorans sp. TaxID=183759 RepID=UPI002AA8E318|nr:hypothetical protein [uncultured Methanomethylovorans sp.]
MTYSYQILAGHIRKRVLELDKNYLGIAVGQTGSGKSATAAQICGTVDPSFFDECRVVLTPAEFMETIQTMDKGEAIMLDEAGIGMSAREWQRVQNRLLGYTAQLFRHKNLVVFFTVPSMGFIDVQLRHLMHGIVSTKAIDYEQKITIAKYYKIFHEPVFNVTKYQTFEYTGTDGTPYALDPLCTPHPEEKFWKKYLRKKEEFATAFYKETEETLKGQTQDKRKLVEIQKLEAQSNALSSIITNLRSEKRSWLELEQLSGVNERTLQRWSQADRQTTKT